MSRLFLDHRISKLHKDSELFETIFSVELPEIKEYRESNFTTNDVTILCNYFKIKEKTWSSEMVQDIYRKIKLFNSKSSNYSVYLVSYSDIDYEEDKILYANYSIGIYNTREVFTSDKIDKLIFKGQNYGVNDIQFVTYRRRKLLDKIKCGYL